MIEQMDSLFGLYREAVMAVSGDEIVYYNAAALKMLPNIDETVPSEIFSEAVLNHTADSFVGETDAAGRRVTFSAVRFGEYRIFSILSSEGHGDITNAAAFSSVCAEMKNYLSVMKMAAGIILPYIENNGDERLVTCAAVVNKSYHNILRLTSNMEVLGVELGERIRKTRFDAVKICGEIADTCSHFIKDGGVKLSFESGVNSLMIRADRDMFELMLMNMISNSLIYTNEGGRVVISVVLSGGSALIKVSDTGEGIPDEVKATAWSRYCEPRILSNAKSGAGFGMAAVSRIARLHGGSVFFESRKNEGTMVAVSIPVGDEDLSVHDGPVYYGEDELSPILTGLSTYIGSDKYKQKYMD